MGTATLIILSEELKDIIKIIKSFEESDLLIKHVIEINQNEPKEQKVDFLARY